MADASIDAAALAIVVVTYNSAAVVADCLRSLPDALSGPGVEVLVVDNDSSDGTADAVAAARPDARFLQLGVNKGYSAGINAGVASCDADAVLVLNPDIELRPDAISSLLWALGAGVGITVPRLVDRDGRTLRSIRREPGVGRAWAEALVGGPLANRAGAGEIVTADEPYLHEHDVAWATGAAMLLSRECLDAVGPFDESFFLYSEETDYMLRAADAGFAVRYVPDAIAVHLGGDLSMSPDLWSRRTVNRVRLQRRRHGRLSTAAFLGASLAGEGVRALAGRPTSRRAAGDLWRHGPRLVVDAPPPVEASAAAPGQLVRLHAAGRAHGQP